MFEKEDYRFTSRLCLHVLEQQRRKLTVDSITLQSDIRNGLHLSNDNETMVQKLWFQKYFVEWLDTHWQQINELLKAHPEYTQSQKKYFITFFAEKYKELLVECIETEVFNTEIIPDFLDIKTKEIKALLDYSDKWEVAYQNLLSDEIKFKEKYRRLIEEEMCFT